MRLFVTALVGSLALGAACFGHAASGESRPSIETQITFFYYKDPVIAASFYEETLGLTKTLDRGWVKVFEITPHSSIGVVAESQGFHKATQPAPVMLTIVTSDLQGWYTRLKSKGARFLKEPPLAGDALAPNAEGYIVRSMMVADPAGYSVEFIERHKKQ